VVPLPEEVAAEELRIADVTTNSMEAFRYYFEGVSHWDDVHKARAEVSLVKALAIDSTFAMAWYHLATVKLRLSNIKLGFEAFEKALKYSQRATEKEQLLINSAYAQYVETDLAKAISISEELVRKYPREKSAIFALGQKYLLTGRTAEAIQVVEQGVALDPSFRTGYNTLGYMYASVQNYEKAE
jgi:tetratricopeptide (TPR) repeat protein